MTRMVRRGKNEASRAAVLQQDRRRLARFFGLQGFHLHATGRQLLLDGAAPSHKAKHLAGAAAIVLAGPLRVVNRLRVMPPDPPPRRTPVRVMVAPAKPDKGAVRGDGPTAKADSGTRNAA